MPDLVWDFFCQESSIHICQEYENDSCLKQGQTSHSIEIIRSNCESEK